MRVTLSSPLLILLALGSGCTSLPNEFPEELPADIAAQARESDLEFKLASVETDREIYLPDTGATSFSFDPAELVPTGLVPAAEFPAPQQINGFRDNSDPHTKFYLLLSTAVGEYNYDDEGFGLDDTDARLHRFSLGGGNNHGRGAGIDLKFIVPDDDLYRGTAQAADVQNFDLFLFFMSHTAQGSFRMPLRIGPYLNRVDTEFLATNQQTDYINMGVRVNFDPEVVLYESHEAEISLISSFSGGLHMTFIDDDLTNDEFSSSGTTLGAELGVRATLGQIQLSTGIIYNNLIVHESDPGLGTRIPRLDTDFTGIQFSMGVRF